jgi:hypothetical protein
MDRRAWQPGCWAFLAQREGWLWLRRSLQTRRSQCSSGARTVEGHLTNVFNKLDVKTRLELRVALAASTQAIRV